MKLYPTSISRRFWAFVLDMIVLVMFMIVVGIVSVIFYEAKTPDWLALTLGFVVLMAYMFYLPLWETFFNGQTPGKYIMRIRVVRTDGSPASGVHCLQRYLFMPFDLVLTVGIGGLVCAMITSRRQRLGDIFADTQVVDSEPHHRCYEKYSYFNPTNAEEKAIHNKINPYAHFNEVKPMELAKTYRDIECDLMRLRTHKSDPAFIDYVERMLSGAHLAIFRKKGYSWGDLLRFVLRSIPRAVYESRWAVLGSLAICVLSYIIGVYSQTVDPDFFRYIMGDYYTDMTIENIQEGNPMGVYGQQDELSMFFGIFTNNFLVTLRLYVMGIFTLIGPLYMLLSNFVMIASFDAFFAQQGLLSEALITPNEHGIIELSSIIMAGGAAIRLGTGWLFPGKLTRLKALARGARQSMLILLSTVPMLLIAAFIESFVTRHTEWPMVLKLGIVIISTVFIVQYYVMLPILSKRK